MSRITGRTAHQEASRRTQTYDILTAIKARKVQWLGHVLRLPDARLVKHAVRVQFENGMLNNLLQDAPITETFEELVAATCGAGSAQKKVESDEGENQYRPCRTSKGMHRTLVWDGRRCGMGRPAANPRSCKNSKRDMDEDMRSRARVSTFR